MALKALLLKKQIDNKRKALDALRQKDEEFKTREAQLTQAIEEVENDEQRAAVEEEINSFTTEKAEHEEAVGNLEREIADLENDLAAEEAAQDTKPPENPAPAENERKDEKHMTREKIPQMTLRDRLADIVERDDSKEFLTTVRDAISNKRAISNVGVLIPDVYLPMIRTEIARSSRLLRFVQVRNLSGDALLNIAGTIPEAVWTDCCANLNEISLGFNQIEAGCHKVGASFGCLAPRLVTGQFDVEKHKAVWPSTGNYCRGGAFNSKLLGVYSIGIQYHGDGQIQKQLVDELFKLIDTL